MWSFKKIVVEPGESALAFYTARNSGDQAVTGVSTYNVTPQRAGIHFNKIQCFCFEEQRLQAGEQVDMPIFFYIDPEFLNDPNTAGVSNIILSYTFFPSSSEQGKKIKASGMMNNH